MEDSFNIQELKKIKKATSGFFKQKARKRIAMSLAELKKEVDEVYKMYPLRNLKPTDEHRKEFLRLLNKYTDKRKEAFASPLASYAHPEWAATAACESWAYILMIGDASENTQAKKLVKELIDRYP